MHSLTSLTPKNECRSICTLQFWNEWRSCFAQILGVHSWVALKRVALLNWLPSMHAKRTGILELLARKETESTPLFQAFLCPCTKAVVEGKSMHGDYKGWNTGNVNFDRLFSSSRGIFVYFLFPAFKYAGIPKDNLLVFSFWLIALNLTSKNNLVNETSKNYLANWELRFCTRRQLNSHTLHTASSSSCNSRIFLGEFRTQCSLTGSLSYYRICDSTVSLL